MISNLSSLQKCIGVIVNAHNSPKLISPPRIRNRIQLFSFLRAIYNDLATQSVRLSNARSLRIVTTTLDFSLSFTEHWWAAIFAEAGVHEEMTTGPDCMYTHQTTWQTTWWLFGMTAPRLNTKIFSTTLRTSTMATAYCRPVDTGRRNSGMKLARTFAINEKVKSNLSEGVLTIVRL